MAVKRFVSHSSMYVWAALRISLGFMFLWAFLDKTFGLGFSTCKSMAGGAIDVGCSQSWLHGGSPTSGFLSNATSGPFSSFYHHLSGHMVIDWLFMLGLLLAGVGLFFGVWVRVAAFIGIVMLLLIWSSLLWPANTPGLDEHLIFALVLFGVALVDEHQVWGLRKWWVKTSIAKAWPVLK